LKNFRVLITTKVKETRSRDSSPTSKYGHIIVYFLLGTYNKATLLRKMKALSRMNVAWL
jgi:hypothetical protein